MYETVVAISEDIPDRIASLTSDFRVVGVYPGENAPRFTVLGRTPQEAWRLARRHRLAYAWLEHWVGSQTRGRWEADSMPAPERKRRAFLATSALSLIDAMKTREGEDRVGLSVKCRNGHIFVCANEDASDDDKRLARMLLRDGWEGWPVKFEGLLR